MTAWVFDESSCGVGTAWLAREQGGTEYVGVFSAQVLNKLWTCVYVRPEFRSQGVFQQFRAWHEPRYGAFRHTNHMSLDSLLFAHTIGHLPASGRPQSIVDDGVAEIHGAGILADAIARITTGT